MKLNYLALGLFAMLTMFSCATKTGMGNNVYSEKTITDPEMERNFKGTWTLTDYSVEGIQENYVSFGKLFGAADIKCFKGSTWNFIPNNATGSYELNATCGSTKQNFKWSVAKKSVGDYFQFKNVYDDVKAKKIQVGYAMRVISVEESTMSMAQELPFEGKKVSIIYKFVKNQ